MANFVCPISISLWFSYSLKWALPDGGLKSKVIFEADFDKKAWAIYRWGKCANLGKIEKFELNIPSDRVFSKLSEYQNITEIRPTELKLLSFKQLLLSRQCSLVVWKSLQVDHQDVWQSPKVKLLWCLYMLLTFWAIPVQYPMIIDQINHMVITWLTIHHLCRVFLWQWRAQNSPSVEYSYPSLSGRHGNSHVHYTSTNRIIALNIVHNPHHTHTHPPTPHTQPLHTMYLAHVFIVALFPDFLLPVTGNVGGPYTHRETI